MDPDYYKACLPDYENNGISIPTLLANKFNIYGEKVSSESTPYAKVYKINEKTWRVLEPKGDRKYLIKDIDGLLLVFAEKEGIFSYIEKMNTDNLLIGSINVESLHKGWSAYAPIEEIETGDPEYVQNGLYTDIRYIEQWAKDNWDSGECINDHINGFETTGDVTIWDPYDDIDEEKTKSNLNIYIFNGNELDVTIPTSLLEEYNSETNTDGAHGIIIISDSIQRKYSAEKTLGLWDNPRWYSRRGLGGNPNQNENKILMESYQFPYKSIDLTYANENYLKGNIYDTPLIFRLFGWNDNAIKSKSVSEFVSNDISKYLSDKFIRSYDINEYNFIDVRDKLSGKTQNGPIHNVDNPEDIGLTWDVQKNYLSSSGNVKIIESKDYDIPIELTGIIEKKSIDILDLGEQFMDKCMNLENALKKALTKEHALDVIPYANLEMDDVVTGLFAGNIDIAFDIVIIVFDSIDLYVALADNDKALIYQASLDLGFDTSKLGWKMTELSYSFYLFKIGVST